MSLLQQMRRLEPLKIPPRSEGKGVSATLLIPARNAVHSLESTVEKAHATMSLVFKNSFEIILIPNPKPGDVADRTSALGEALTQKFTQVRSIPHSLPQGKGAALRTGFLASRGDRIFFTDADLPYPLSFIGTANSLLDQGYELVTANRRLPDSEFDIPLELLPLAYGRHRLGLAFNQVVRALFPIRTTDTQAGIKAFSRRLATQAFSRQICPGFFFDLELFLTALHGDSRWAELPVTLTLYSEKSTVRLAREAILALFWLFRLSLRNQAGAYRDDSSL